MTSQVRVSNDEQFDQDVLHLSDHQLVLVEVGADWCAPCRALMPVLHKLANELEGQLTLITLNADECSNTMSRLAVRGLPTVLLFKNNVVIDRFQGGFSETDVRAFLEPHVAHSYRYWVNGGQQRLASGDTSGIEDLRKAVNLAPGNSTVLATLIHALLDGNTQHPDWLQEANARLEHADPLLQRDPLMQQVRSRCQLVSVTNRNRDTTALRQAHRRYGESVNAFELANALAAQEQYDEAMVLLLGILRKPDGSVDQERVRAVLINLLNTCPDRSLANRHRRTLFALLRLGEEGALKSEPCAHQPS